MKIFVLSIILSGIFVTYTVAQPATLFDDTRLSSVYITLPADSLEVLYDSILSDHYYIARFVFDDTEKRDTIENIGFRLRGNTSRYSQKKSFKVSFNEYVPGRRYQGVKKINLNGEHNDPTMIREKLFYDLWKRAGMEERRTSFVKVYINGSYYGLYTNLEEMDKDWLDRVYHNKDGNLYKCTYPADLVYHGPSQQTYKDLENSTTTGGRVYELQTNESLDDYSRLVQLISVLDHQLAGNFAGDISAILQVDHFLKALALDVATGNWDNYSYNRNNFYLYDNPADGKFDFVTYDPDNTFGIDWFGIDWGTRDCRNWVNPSMSLPLAQKLLAVPVFYEQYKRHLDTIALTIIAPDSVFPRIDAMKALIRQAAEEDVYRTLDYGYTVADFNNAFTQPTDDHTPYGLKPFFGTRRQSILNQLHPAGISSIGSAENRFTLFPNPASAFIGLKMTDAGEKPYEVKISDIYGKTMLGVNLVSLQEMISVAGLPAGMYVLTLKTAGAAYQQKFIKH